MEESGVSEELDWMLLAGKRAKGRRPAFFDDPAVDRLLSIVMALVAELSVLRERQDTVERLLEAKGVLARADIEAFEPDAGAGLERGSATRAYIMRVMRGVQQDLEAMQSDDAPVEEVSKSLGEM